MRRIPPAGDLRVGDREALPWVAEADITRHSGADAVAEAVRAALEAFTAPEGSVTLRGWYRAVIARG